jgi:hypothetical protein
LKNERIFVTKIASSKTGTMSYEALIRIIVVDPDPEFAGWSDPERDKTFTL